MTRRYARSPRGQRAQGKAPVNYGKNVTLIGAMTCDGLLAAMSVELATDGDVFKAYLDQVLCPHLKADHVVVMDNLPAHKVRGVRERIEATGAQLEYLPAYSPDFNPIEQCWSKMKAHLRKVSARTGDRLDEAITEALGLVTASDAAGWFEHCGYCVKPN